MSIKTLNTREVYRNQWMRVREDAIERSDGTQGIYGVVDKEDGAVIIPIQDGRVYLVEQFRYTIQRRSLELPQGGWETYDVAPEELARGELREETGFDADTMIHLGTTFLAYGFLNQKQHIFLATGLKQVGTDFDPEEHDLTLHSVTVEEFERMLLDGTIMDNCSLAAWGMYKLWKEKRS